MEGQPAPKKFVPEGPLFMSEDAVDALMKEHRVPRREQVTLGSDGQWLINGESVEEWDRINALYEGSDNPYDKSSN